MRRVEETGRGVLYCFQKAAVEPGSRALASHMQGPRLIQQHFQKENEFSVKLKLLK